MIDNFAQIRNLLRFPTQYSFYFLEIIKRKKENPDMKNHAKLIKDYYLDSLVKFDEKETEIKELCNLHNARAYFSLNVREADKIAFLYNERLAKLLTTKDFKNIPRAYPAVVGEFHQDLNKKWLLDVDGFGEDLDYLVTDVVLFLDKLTENPTTVITKIRTKNGVHLITKPFRKDTFKVAFPNIEIHPCNPTILYMP